jgi:hypothetical protein
VFAGPRLRQVAIVARDRDQVSVTGLTIEVSDPVRAAQRWAAVLGVAASRDGEGAVVELADSGQVLRFSPAAAGRGEGVTAVTIAGLPCEGPVEIGGVRFARHHG